MTQALKTIEGLATVVIAVYVASIGTFQWITARDKLRLDLYDRRFEVYLSALDFMQALMMWTSVPVGERLPKRIAFIRASRESRFLFADELRIFRPSRRFQHPFLQSHRIRRGIEQIHRHHAQGNARRL